MTASDLDGGVITFKKDNAENLATSLAYPPPGADRTVATNNNLLLLADTLYILIPDGTSNYFYGGAIIGGGSTIANTADVRVSINPAMQLLDYLMSKRYGKGLDVDLINFDSFKEVARACDSQSDGAALISLLKLQQLQRAKNTDILQQELFMVGARGTCN